MMADKGIFTGAPGPVRTPETDAFWSAAKDGKFLVPRCQKCGKAHWYPRGFCPFCYGPIVFEAASGKGEIYTYSLVGQGENSYVLAYVTLAEGPKVLTNIAYSDIKTVRVGAAVELHWVEAHNGERLPAFSIS